MCQKLRRFVYLLVVAPFVLALSAPRSNAQVLYNFGNVAGDPVNPTNQSAITQGRDGALYSTSASGDNVTGFGPMFRITTTGKMSEPFSFGSATGVSNSGLTLGTNGNFYGTTFGGMGGIAVLYELTPTGSLNTLYTFDTSDGSKFEAPPIQGTDGNLYGVATQGGSSDCGYIYKLTLPGNTYSVPHQFGNTDGCDPFAPLLQGTDGNFYGTTTSGGTGSSGVVFKISAAGHLSVVFNFDGTKHGGSPVSPLIQATDGNFYGTTTGGGKFGTGTVFKMTPAGHVTLLHSINGTTDGYGPIAGLVQATDGNFYGTAPQGGNGTNCASGCGTIFRVTPAGVFDVIYNFDGTTGQDPLVTLFQHTDGLLYGDTFDGGTGGGLPGGCTVGNCGVFYSVNIGAAPFASLVTPSGKVGKTVEILGQGFKGTTGVSFAGTAALTFDAVTSTYLTATVPAGAETGPVTVTTPGGPLVSSKNFRVTPQITSFNPPSGPVGTSVTITGVSLTQTSKITFGGVAATSFTVNSDTQVTSTVPTGTVTGKVGITTAGGTATSASNFTVN